MAKPLFEGTQWTFALIQEVLDVCEKIGREELRFDFYTNQIEIVSTDQMLDTNSSIGMPIFYKWWGFGKRDAMARHLYNKGMTGNPFEIILNSQPCIALIMEDNTMTMQTLVIAHACIGHSSFFKMNEFFRQWTDAEGIIDYLLFAKNYVVECEEKYGLDEVEKILDSCHALQQHGIDRYRRPGKLSAKAEKDYLKSQLDEENKSINEIWKTLPKSFRDKPQSIAESDLNERQKFLKLPEENLLYFIEKKSPTLKTWQRELVRIVRKIAQYFYPQGETRVMNEGLACMTHYYIMNRLHDKGLIDDASMLEFIHSHTNVVHQRPFDDPHYNGINPYALGFDMYMDIKRICEEPTEEDKEWFPDLANTPWLDAIHFAMINFRDESFIRQYLSPHLMRKWHMFSIDDDSKEKMIKIENIHNERGYKKIRSCLANQYSSAYRTPDIQVYDVNLSGDRTLHLRHQVHNSRPLDKDTTEVLKHVMRLWGYGVVLESYDSAENKVINKYDVKL
jgi:spore cortex formation protein SpoVR/YcgB (stage V sporulation)